MKMSFLQKYSVTPMYLPTGSRRRPGDPINPEVKFIVVHDTGNPGSTARNNVRFYSDTAHTVSPKKVASAHVFVDDREILECIPALTGSRPERAIHVYRQVQSDNNLFGFDANDAAIGIEYCFGKGINADEAYKRYVWTIAYTCFKFSLDPSRSIVSHKFLDPTRRADPDFGLGFSRRTYQQLLTDVVDEYNECTGKPPRTYEFIAEPGTARTTVKLNIRKRLPSTRVEVVQVAQPGTEVSYIGYVTNGEVINGNSKWFKDVNGNFFWSGGF